MSSPVGRQLRDFAIVATLALLVATTAFVAVRNTELASRQIDLAVRSAKTIGLSGKPLPGVTGGVVAPATTSKKHPYLRHRRITDEGGNRELGGAGSTRDDKLFYDYANRYDVAARSLHGRSLGIDQIAELLPDGSGRAIAVLPVPEDMEGGYDGKGDAWTTKRSGGVVVAVTSPARPDPYPFLVMIGVLGLGAAFAAAGALVGGRAASVGMFASIAALAVPTILWGAPIATTTILVLAAAITVARSRGATDRIVAGVRKNRTALSFLAPAAISMFVLVAAPFVIGIIMGFYDHHHGTWTFVGLSNFTDILSGGGRSLDDPLNFWFILGVTVLWTIANIALHVTIGVSLALLLSRKWIAGRGVWRMLLILPWAIPNYITALIWHGMYDGQYGAINSLLHACGLSEVSWMGSFATAFSANVITNTWLGFPFMMVVALGALETIPKELYEAASVDGASKWQMFRHITLPHLRPALGPAVALGSIWTFNMFNVIYLVSGGNPGNSTNILVTDAYRWAFERGERYGMAAAEATIIFLILLLWTVFGNRIARRKNEEAEA